MSAMILLGEFAGTSVISILPHSGVIVLTKAPGEGERQILYDANRP